MDFKSINNWKECMAGRQLQRFIIFVNFTVFEAHFSKNIQQITKYLPDPDYQGSHFLSSYGGFICLFVYGVIICW